MPKRKRGQNDSEEDLQRQEVEAKIVHGKKLLNKVLKLAKNFERQKLDKRIKLSDKENDVEKKRRLENEQEVLKVSLIVILGGALLNLVTDN
jgi:hypothetical protein